MKLSPDLISQCKHDSLCTDFAHATVVIYLQISQLPTQFEDLSTAPVSEESYAVTFPLN